MFGRCRLIFHIILFILLILSKNILMTSKLGLPRSTYA